jgi:glycosyltransferase involved in cell wall biosynthesis
MEWHVITGEYPPQLGGVSDYAQQICNELVEGGDVVHVWTPEVDSAPYDHGNVQVHSLPRGFGRAWLKELNRGLRNYPAPRNILVQYVPHMYGWKSMNVAFCRWIARQKNQNVYVMFHEVAFPFRIGQPWRHRLLAVVHRIMARKILGSVRHSFTSTDEYLSLLQSLGQQKAHFGLLRICSNIPPRSYADGDVRSAHDNSAAPYTVGIFSNFNPEICEVLEPAIGCLLQNPEISVALLGPGELFRDSLACQNPEAAGRISSTGRLHVTEVGRHMQSCDALLQLYPSDASAARGTLIGSMASGVPVVTTCGPATDLLLVESESLVFAEGSPQSIRDAVEMLMENPERAKEIGARARNLYRQYFHPAVIVARLRGLAGGGVQLPPPAKDLKIMDEEAGVRQ